MEGHSSQMQTGSDNEATGIDSDVFETNVRGNKRKRNAKNAVSDEKERKKIRSATLTQVSNPIHHSDPQSQKPKSEGIEKGLHGIVFQLHLTMLFLCKGLSKGYSYELLKEKGEFLPFDDIVFIYKKRGDPKRLHRFLQAKHKQDKKTIEMSDLEKGINEYDNIFSLQKYYDGYRRIIQQEKVKISEIKDFVICTNARFSEELKNTAKEIVDENCQPVKDDILYYDDYNENINDQDRPVMYNLDLETTEQGRELFKKLCLISDLPQLARDLVEAVSHGSVTLNEKFVKYHIALMETNVIAINSETIVRVRKSKPNDVLNGKFHDSFKDLANEDRSFEHFRSAFREEAFKKVASEMEINKVDVGKDVLNQLNEEVAKELAKYATGELKCLSCFKLLEDKRLIRKVRNKENYKFKKDFIQGNFELYFKDILANEIFSIIVRKCFKLDDNFGKIITSLDNVDDFVEKFAKLLEEHRHTESKIIEIERCDEMVNNICKLSKYVLFESNGTIMFHPKFLGDDELPFNLNVFKTKLKHRISFEFDELVQFQFLLKSFPKFDLRDESFNQENDVKAFLKKLIFAVNQPDDTVLRDIISKNENIKGLRFLKPEFITDHLQNYILEFLTSKQKKSCSDDTVKRFFEVLKVEITNLVFLSLSSSSMADIRKYEIEFKEGLQIFRKIKDMHRKTCKKKILIIYQKSALLTEIKMCQVLKSCSERYVYLNVESLLSLCQDASFNPTNALKSDSILFVTLVFHSALSERTQKLIRDFLDILRENTKTKLILIFEKKYKELDGKTLISFLEEFLRGYIEDYMEDDENKFSDLTDSSQKILLQKRNLLFKTEKVSLGEFIGSNNLDYLTSINSNSMNKIVDPDTLSKLIMNEGIRIANQLPLYEFEHSYIDIHRVFNLRNRIRLTECLNKNITDKFSISCIHEDELRKLVPPETKIHNFENHDQDTLLEVLQNERTKLFIVNNESIEKLLRHKYFGCNIHFLKYVDKNFVWQKSHGNLNSLCEFLINEEFKPRTIEDFNDRLVVIASEPGMGKSTLLTHLWKQSEKDLWVFRITIRNHKEKLESANFNDLNGIITFLGDIGILETELSKVLILHRLEHQGKVFLLLDGYDEVESHFREKVVQLVKTLTAETKAGHIWVTTRTYLQQELQQELGLFSYTLNPFDKSDQKNYLLEFWKEKCNIGETDKRMENYADKLLEHFKEEEKCIGIVLQTQMLAEAFCDDFENFYRDHNQNGPDFKHTFDLHGLYNRFIDAKYQIHLAEKIKVAGILRSGERHALTKYYGKRHGYLSLKALFSLCPEVKDFLEKKEDPNPKEEPAIIGIIKDFHGDDINFIHRTYAEYFAADFVIDKLKKEDLSCKFKLIYEFLLRQIFRDRNKIIRSFIEKKVKNGNDDLLKNRWQTITDCDLIKNSRPFPIVIYFTKTTEYLGGRDLFLHEKTLEDCRKVVESHVRWIDGEYYYNHDKELTDIKILFERFLMETDIEKLKSPLKYLLTLYNKSKYYLANIEISKNIMNAVSHFLTQAKTQNATDYNLTKVLQILADLFPHSRKFEVKFDEFTKCSEENDEKRVLSKDLIKLFISRNNAEKQLSSWDRNANEKGSLKYNIKKKLRFLKYQNAKKLLFFLIEHWHPAEKSYIEDAIKEEFCTGKDFKWLERTGVEIVTGFEILTTKMSDAFCSVLNESIHSEEITGWDTVYVEKIITNLILPTAEKITNENCPGILKLELIKMFVRFLKFIIKNNCRLEITQNQFQATLKVIEKELEGNKRSPQEAISESAKYLYLLGESGLKIINFNEKLLILHPVNEIQYEMCPDYKDNIIKSIKRFLRNP